MRRLPSHRSGRPERPEPERRQSASERRQSVSDRRSPALVSDERGVSEVLGAILIFALVVLLISLIQLNAVPAENQQVEFEHNQRVQGDMLSLDRAILAAATENVPGSTKIEMAARYPSRFFLVNPPVRSGSIETTEPGFVEILNAKSDSLSNYWTDDPAEDAKRFETRFVRYRPSYNEYRSPPDTVYEHNALVNKFDSGAVLPIDSGSFIQGDDIVLVTVDGRISRASATSEAVESEPLSAPAQSIPVSAAGGSNVVLELPTTLSKSDWTDILEDELVSNGGHVKPIGFREDEDETDPDPYDTVIVTLEKGHEYDLRLAKVGVGESTRDPRSHYIAAVRGQDDESIRADETRALAVEVRDKFNNPTDGTVRFEFDAATPGGTLVDGPNSGPSLDVRADEGTAQVVFVPDSDFTGSVDVTATLLEDEDGDGTVDDPVDLLRRETVSFSVGVGDVPDSVASINPVNPGTVQIKELNPIKETGSGNQGDKLEIVLVNTGQQDRTLERIRMPFFVPSQDGKIPESVAVENTVAGESLVVTQGWVEFDQPFRIDRDGGEQTVTLTFPKGLGSEDFFGLSVEFDDITGNYFIQIPKKADGSDGGDGGQGQGQGQGQG